VHETEYAMSGNRALKREMRVVFPLPEGAETTKRTDEAMTRLSPHYRTCVGVIAPNSSASQPECDRLPQSDSTLLQTERLRARILMP
jgi:hypothetical protein